MLIDGRTVAQGQILRSDVCIVGAGPAGLALARDFIGRGIDVLLVESGGFEADAATQALAHADVEDSLDQYPDPFWSSYRQFGGTAAGWVVTRNGELHFHLGAFDDGEFAARDWLPGSGWPIDARTLAPYGDRVHAICKTHYHASPLADWETPDRKAIAFADGGLLTTPLVAGRRAVFTDEIRDRLIKDPAVDLLLWSNVVELETDPDGRTVTAAKAVCLNGPRFRIEARHFVLAQGAYQVPRLLLASRAGHTAAIGNAHDLVGRHLMDRQVIRTGIFERRQPIMDFGFYDLHPVPDGAMVVGKMALSRPIRERERILGAMIGFVARPDDRAAALAERIYGRGTTYRSPGLRSMHGLATALRERRWPERAFGQLAGVLRNLDDIVYQRIARPMSARDPVNRDNGGWSAQPDSEQRYRRIEVYQVSEQAPDPENRITLDPSRRDATGMPLPKLRMRWNELDIRSAARTQELVAQALQASGIGRLRYERRDGVPLMTQVSTHHPAGTARMSADPRRGVVDANCRVHGTTNLHVASSAVFPTGGSIPPTLTIMALALRIGDTIRAALQAPLATAAASITAAANPVSTAADPASTAADPA